MDNNISEIVSASLDVSKNSVMFEFKTPLSAGIRYDIIVSFVVIIQMVVMIMMISVIEKFYN